MRHFNYHGRCRSTEDQQEIATLLRKGYAEVYLPDYDPQVEALSWSADSGQFVVVPIPVPDSITPLQRNLWLGPDRYNQALAFINALPDAAQRFEAMRHWLNANTTRRDNPWTIAIAKQCLGMTDEEIDQAFREAAAL